VVAGLWRVPFKKASMIKTLGGFGFIREGIKYDYCFEQSIQSLCDCCDKVAIVFVNSDADSTYDTLYELKLRNTNLEVHFIHKSLWRAMKGKTKLANIQNIAAMCLDTDYQLLAQGDEVLHPDSYKAVREAIETGGDGFLCERINLWGSPNTKLVVPQQRQPCSTYVNRLTKRGFWCYDDGESIASPTTFEFANRIKIIHYGFVRKREVMKAKIINMQEGVFQISHDPKLDLCETFDSTLWFKDSDLAPIDFQHPPFMEDWVKNRL
jgi:hypothetical protein